MNYQEFFISLTRKAPYKVCIHLTLLLGWFNVMFACIVEAKFIINKYFNKTFFFFFLDNELKVLNLSFLLMNNLVTLFFSYLRHSNNFVWVSYKTNSPLYQCCITANALDDNLFLDGFNLFVYWVKYDEQHFAFDLEWFLVSVVDGLQRCVCVWNKMKKMAKYQIFQQKLTYLKNYYKAGLLLD